MTVSTEINYVLHRGTGFTRVFPYNFQIPDASMVYVTLVDWVTLKPVATLIPGQYTITGIGGLGGSVTYDPVTGPLDRKYGILITREVPYTQGLRLTNEGGFYPESIERQLDLIVMQIQQIRGKLSRVQGQILESLTIIGQLHSETLAARNEAVRAAAEAGQAKTQAELAAIAAGAPLYTTPPDLATAPSPYMLLTDAGVQVFTHDGTTATFEGWLGKIVFKDVADLVNFPFPLNPLGTIVEARGFRFEVVAAEEDLTTVGGVKVRLVPEPYSTYRMAGTQKPRGLNDSLASGGFDLVRTPAEELRDIYEFPQPFPQAPMDLAQVIITPPGEESTNFIAPSTPWISHDGSGLFRVIPVDIRTILGNTPISVPLFRPVKTNGWGMLVWQYIGKEPLHTTISGTFDMAVRTSGTLSTAWSRLILTLRSWDTPELELGENRGGRHLATSLGALTVPQPFRDVLEFNDTCGPITSKINTDVATQPEMFVGSVNGFFNSGDTTEELRTSDDAGPIGPEVRTTQWIDLQNFPPDTHIYVFYLTGKSSRGRVQYKTASGTIRTYTAMTRDVSARKLYRAPLNARYIRIYYSGRGDTAGNESFKAVPPATAAEYDPLKGYWDRRLMSVERDVVFWPGASYALELFTSVYDGGNARDWGFRYQGGGLSFLFDAGNLRRDLTNKLYRRV